MKQDEKTFTFRIPCDLLDNLHKYADENDMSVAQVVRKVVRDFVASTLDVK